MRYLSTVYVREHRARISHHRGSLFVSGPESKQRIPLQGIEGVMILGGAQITTGALAACVEQNVRVASLKRNGGIRFVVSGPIGGNVHLRTALHRAVADPEHSLALSRVVVGGKLQNCRQVVRRWARDHYDDSIAEDLRTRAEQIAGRIGRLATAESPGSRSRHRRRRCQDLLWGDEARPREQLP